MSVCLELQPLLLSMLQHNGRPQEDVSETGNQNQPKARPDHLITTEDDFMDALQLILNATSTEIFKARTGSPHPRVQQLFAVDEYRSLVQYTVQVNWQCNENDLFVEHAENLALEKSMSETLGTHVETLGENKVYPFFCRSISNTKKQCDFSESRK
jgi:hypothetical protein